MSGYKKKNCRFLVNDESETIRGGLRARTEKGKEKGEIEEKSKE
jgi:hypothetical protein